MREIREENKENDIFFINQEWLEISIIECYICITHR